MELLIVKSLVWARGKTWRVLAVATGPGKGASSSLDQSSLHLNSLAAAMKMIVVITAITARSIAACA